MMALDAIVRLVIRTHRGDAMNKITKTKEGWEATCTCGWKRGYTSVELVAKAWVEIHDCEKDASQKYSIQGCKRS